MLNLLQKQHAITWVKFICRDGLKVYFCPYLKTFHMRSNEILMNPNELVQFLKKPAGEFTRDDIIRFVEAKGIYEN